MKSFNKKLLFFIMLLNTFILSSCWNYREINDFSIVAGIAVDKEKSTGKYILTIEIMNPIEGQGMNSKLVKTKGDSVFDSYRQILKTTGKKAYWSHSKVLILSKEINKSDLITIMDLVNRDREMRGDMNILVSKEDTASKILYKAHEPGADVTSFNIAESLKNQKHVSHYISMNIWEFTEALFAEGYSPLLPSIEIEVQEGVPFYKLSGSVAFKRDKQVGVLNDNETKWALIVMDKLEGGSIVVESKVEEELFQNTLEIFKNKTKIKPEYKDDKLTMNINVELDVGIIELNGQKDFIEEKGRMILQEDTENYIKREVQKVIEKAQMDIESDIFGFSSIIMRKMPKEWKEKIQPNWEEDFKKLDTRIEVKINIRNSGLISKPIEVGE